MKRAYMLIPENPPHSHGDCIRACVASIFELPAEEVPYFGGGRDEVVNGDAPWLADLRVWAGERGFFVMLVRVDDPSRLNPASATAFHHIRFGANNPDGTGHAAIYYGNSLVHDPDPQQQGEYLEGVWPQYQLFFVKR